MQVILLTPKQVVEHWRTIESAIASALKSSVGESTTYDYLTWLQDPEHYQCWAVQDEEKIVNISITKINTYATHKSLHLITTTGINGGRWDTYKEAHHTIEDYARSRGCRRIEMYGRKGWSRVLNKLEGSQNEKYKEVYVVHSMELKNE
ncbi:hypothetical protein PQZ39_00970 [bacterium]|nr:hypothetical protein [bacterium]